MRIVVGTKVLYSLAMTTGRWFLTAFATLALSGAAHASTITTLYNTGVGAGGSPLPNGTVGDPHYILTSVPGGTTTLQVVTSTGGFPVGPWLADDSISAWVGPDTAQTVSPAGNYDYQTTFNLTGFLPATAFLTGQWAADNAGLNILVNGVSTGITAAGLSSWTPFTIGTGFVAGVNTLDFIVQNFSGVDTPTGLRVEMSGTANLSAATPEPATLVLLGAGLIVLSSLRRRARS